MLVSDIQGESGCTCMHTYFLSLLRPSHSSPTVSKFQTHLPSLLQPTTLQTESHAIRQTIFFYPGSGMNFFLHSALLLTLGITFMNKIQEHSESSLFHITPSFLMRPGLCALVGVRQEEKSQEKK